MGGIMERFWLFAILCLAGGILIAIIDIFVVAWLGCKKSDLLPIILRSLILMGSLLIFDPWARSHIFFAFSIAFVFDYSYTSFFKSE